MPLHRGRPRATRVPRAPAHDSFTRLPYRIESDPEVLWAEARPMVVLDEGALVIDDITTLWTDGDRKIPVDYRILSKADGKTKNDHSWEMMLMAKGRGFRPKVVPFNSWHASLENLKVVRGHGWHWQTRLKANRRVTPDDRIGRHLDEVAIGTTGTNVSPQGYGMIRVFRTDDTDGVAEYTATSDLGMDVMMQQYYAEISFAIENDHRDLRQHCEVDRSQVRSERGQRNHIGLAIRAFLRLEWHFFTTGISGFEAKLRIIRDAIRGHLRQPSIRLPDPATA